MPKVQSWMQQKGPKFLILLAGRDAADEGGPIKQFNEHLNPQVVRVVALNSLLTRPGSSPRPKTRADAPELHEAFPVDAG